MKIQRLTFFKNPATSLACSLLIASHSLSADTVSTPTAQLNTLVVTASRIETPLSQVGSAITVIDRDEIENRGHTAIIDLLRTQPGLSATNSGGRGKVSAIRVRGEESFRTKIKIDGVEISDPSGPQTLPLLEHLVVSGEIERIEILRGPQGLIHGADAGGVISITTRTPTPEFSGQFATEAGRYDTTQVSGFITDSDEHGGYFLSFTDQASDGFNAATADTSGERDGYDNITVHGKLSRQITDHLSAQAVIRDVNANSEFDQCGFPASNDCESAYDQTIARLAITHDHPIRNQQGAVTFSDIDRADSNDGSQSFLTKGKTVKFEYLNTTPLNDHTQLLLGGDHETQSVLDTSGTTMERHQLGLFGEVQAALTSDFTLTGGLRHDQNEDFGEHNSLRTTAAYLRPISENRFVHSGLIKYRASAGTGFRAPSLFEIAYNGGPFAFGEAAATDLQEEKSRGFDFGFDYLADSGIEFSLTYFDQQIQDEIFFDLTNFSGYLQATGETQSKGTELNFLLPLTESVSLSGNYTYNETKTFDNQQRIRRPRNAGNLTVQAQATPRLQLLANVRASRGTIDETFSTGRLPLDDYGVLDVSGAYRLVPGVTLTARVDNVTDETYEELSGFNTPGAAVYTGVRIDF